MYNLNCCLVHKVKITSFYIEKLSTLTPLDIYHHFSINYFFKIEHIYIYIYCKIKQTIKLHDRIFVM